MDKVRGDVLRPPYGTTPAAVKLKSLTEEPVEARNTSKKGK